MKNFLKVSLIMILIGISMIIFFCLYTGDYKFNSINDIIISQYESGIYTEQDISYMKLDKILNDKNTKLAIYAKYLDIQVSNDVDRIHIQYYDLPNVKIEFNENSEGNFSANFLNTDYEIVFNKNIEEYKKVKMVIPKDMKLDVILLSGKDVIIDGINSENMYIFSNMNYLKNKLNISNININKMHMNLVLGDVSVKNSKIDDFEIQAYDSNLLFENISGNNINFGKKNSKSERNINTTLNNVDYQNQGYYGDNINVDINNKLPLSNYYFNLIKIDETGEIKLNDKEYLSNYESDNINDCKYKISVKSNKINLKVN